MRYEHWAWIAACGLAFFAGCRKDEAEEAPVVTIVSPVNGFDLGIPDTLMVAADVSGAETVDRVTFSITNANGVPIIPPLQAVPAANPARIEVAIPLTSDLIASASYTLTVQAFSGGSSGKDHRILDIAGAPLRLRRVMALGEPVPGTTEAYIIDSTGASNLVNTLLMDLGGAAVSSAAQVFAVMGSANGPLLALKPDGLQVRWQKPGQGQGSEWFTSLDMASDGRFYVGTTDGRLRGYNASTGATEFTAVIADEFRVRHMELLNDRLVTAEQDIGGSSWRLEVFLAPSGAYIEQQVLNKEVVALFRRDDAHVLIFGNQGSTSAVEDRNINGGGGWEPRTWPARISAVERVDANTFLVALESGALERFTYSNAGSLLIANIPAIADLSLDPASGLVHAATGNSVQVIDPQSGQVTATHAVGGNARYVLPLMNR